MALGAGFLGPRAQPEDAALQNYRPPTPPPGPPRSASSQVADGYLTLRELDERQR